MRLFIFIMLTSGLLLGCGQKGALYREPSMQTNQVNKSDITKDNNKPITHTHATDPID